MEYFTTPLANTDSFLGADPENSERGGRVLPPLHPAWNENFTFQDGAYIIVGVFMMQSEVTLTFQKIELKSIL